MPAFYIHGFHLMTSFDYILNILTLAGRKEGRRQDLFFPLKALLGSLI